MRMSAPAGPALLPSYATNETLASEPTIFWKISESVISPSTHTLVVQIQQPPSRVIGPFDGPVGVTVVVLPELLALVERGRVERLVAVQVVHGLLDHAVVITVVLPARQRDHAPEPEVHVEPPRLQRIERPAPRRLQRAHPDRHHADLVLEELQELRAALDRDLHVLDDRLLLRVAAPPVDPGGDAVALVEADEPAVDVGAHPPARHQRPDHRLLHAEGA